MSSSNACERAWAKLRPDLSEGSNDPKQQTQRLFNLYLASKSVVLRNKITEVNQGLVVTVATRYQNRCSAELEDLVQIGTIGLMKAVEKFDPARGVAFSSFAVPYIEGEIQHFQRDRRSLAKIPRRWQEASDQVRSLQDKFLKAGREVPLVQCAASLGIAPELWAQIHEATRSQVFASLDEEAHDIPAKAGLSVEEREHREAMEDAAIAALDSLPDLERACLLERFWGELANEVIGKRHRLTAAEVEATIARGLQQLKGVTAVC